MDTKALQMHYEMALLPEKVAPPAPIDVEVAAEPRQLKMEDIILPSQREENDGEQYKPPRLNVQHQKVWYNSLKELMVKYVGHYDMNEIEALVEKADRLRVKKKWKKDEVLLAAVFYCQYLDQIKLTIRTFCSLNNFTNRVFLKKFRACMEHMGEKRPLLYVPTAPNGLRGQADMSIQRAIQLVYDSIFRTNYMQEHRREVIQALCERLQEIDPRVMRQMEHLRGAQKTYYLMFEFLREMNMRIQWCHFRKVVGQKAGYTLNCQQHFRTKALFSKYRQLSPSDAESEEDGTS